MCALRFTALCLTLAVPARAENSEPTPEAVRQAADQFNRGRDAFRQGEFTGAADYFEKADDQAPNAKVLRLAIESRVKAGQKDRAATLAALALQLYPDDTSAASYTDLVREASSELGRLRVECGEPCTVLVGSRLIHGPAARRRTVFLEPGDYRVRAFWGERGALSRELSVSAGSTEHLSFSRPEVARQEEPRDEPAPSPSDAWGAPGAGRGAAKIDVSASEPESLVPQKSGKPLPTPVFWVGVAATVGLAGAGIWSGVDAATNPGKAKVTEACAGKTTGCPEYQEGLRKQFRTNVLWGVTAGVGVVTTLIGVVWTNWEGSKVSVPPQTGISRLRVTPIWGLGASAGHFGGALQSESLGAGLLGAGLGVRATGEF